MSDGISRNADKPHDSSESNFYKTQKLISEIFRKFPGSRIITHDEYEQRLNRDQKPASRRTRRAPARADRRRQGSESYDLFDLGSTGGAI